MTPLASAYLASGLASALSLLLARRSPSHRPIAAMLCTGLACDAVVRACGREPEGLRFGLALLAGQVYPWAVVGAVSVSLTGGGGWGRKGRGKSHPGAPTCAGGCAHGAVRRGLACEAIPAVSPSGGRSVAWKDQGPAAINPSGLAGLRTRCASGPAGTLFRAVSLGARILAPLSAPFTIYAAALLSSGLRGPALARSYAGAQAVVAVVLVGVVWGWEKRRRDVAPARRRRGQASGRPLRLMPGGQPARGQRGGRGGEDMARGLDAVGNDCGSVSLPDAATPRPPSATEICAIICAAAEVANAPAYLLLPYWTSARAVYAVAYLLLCIVQLEALCRRSSSVT